MPFMEALRSGTPWPLSRIVGRPKTQTPQNPADVFANGYHGGREHPADADDAGADGFLSGRGLDDPATKRYADCITAFIRRQRVLSVVEFGCGDFRIGRQIADLPIHYVGIDSAEPLIAANRSRYTADNVQFRCLDIVADPWPRGELCLLRGVLQHLTNGQILAILPKLRRFKWIVATEVQLPGFQAATPNREKPPGAQTRLPWGSFVDLGAPPFSVPNMRLLLSVPGPRTDDAGLFFTNSFLIRPFAC
jgi:hypothetical protein